MHKVSAKTPESTLAREAMAARPGTSLANRSDSTRCREKQSRRENNISRRQGGKLSSPSTCPWKDERWRDTVTTMGNAAMLTDDCRTTMMPSGRLHAGHPSNVMVPRLTSEKCILAAGPPKQTQRLDLKKHRCSRPPACSPINRVKRLARSHEEREERNFAWSDTQHSPAAKRHCNAWEPQQEHEGRRNQRGRQLGQLDRDPDGDLEAFDRRVLHLRRKRKFGEGGLRA